MGFSQYGCPEGTVCQADGSCAAYDDHKQLAFGLTVRPDPERDVQAKTDGSLRAYVEVATQYLNQALAVQAPLLERLGMQVQSLDRDKLTELAHVYSDYDKRLQELDALAIEVAKRLQMADPSLTLDQCNQELEAYAFGGAAIGEQRKRLQVCLSNYGHVLVALELAATQLTSFDPLVFARMRTGLMLAHEAIVGGKSVLSTDELIRLRDLAPSIHAISEEVLQALATAQMMFPIVRMQVSVDTGAAVLAHRIGHFAQMAAGKSAVTLPFGVDVMVLFQQAVSQAVGEMKRNETALAQKLVGYWPAEDAWQLAPAVEHAGLLVRYPELAAVHAEMKRKLASMENWQPLLTGVSAGVCFVGGVAALFSFIGTPLAFGLCAPATVFGVIGWHQIAQVNANAQMLAYFGPEQGLVPGQVADALAKSARWAGTFVALDFLGFTADVVGALRALDGIKDALHLRRLRHRGLTVDLLALPPLRAGGGLGIHPSWNREFQVPWGPAPIQFGFELETNSVPGIGAFYAPANIPWAEWAAMPLETRGPLLQRAYDDYDGLVRNPDPRLSGFPAVVYPDVGSFEMNGFPPITNYHVFLTLRRALLDLFSLTTANGQRAFFHTHISFPWSQSMPVSELTHYWLLWNERFTHTIDEFFNPWFGPVSRDDLLRVQRELTEGPANDLSKWHFLGFRGDRTYGGSGRVGLELRAAGNVPTTPVWDDQAGLAPFIAFMLVDPSSSSIRLIPNGKLYNLLEVDPTNWDLPGEAAFARFPAELQAYLVELIRALGSERHLLKLTTNLSVPMVDWSTRPFLAHRADDILEARAAFIEALEKIRTTEQSPREAVDAIKAAFAEIWGTNLKLWAEY